MFLKSLELENYRNYEKLSLIFDEHTNIFFGNNAQGKTNILESIYVACTTKSHRRSKDSEIIRFESESSHIRLILEKKQISYRIDMQLGQRKKKSVAINLLPIRKASELLGVANIIFFSPEDLNIIKNGPQERRRFVDMELCQLDKMYLSDLVNYQKCLNQKNKLLKDISGRLRGDSEVYGTLDIWDEQLRMYGSRVIERRRRFIDDLCPILKEKHTFLTGGNEKIDLIYEPNIDIDNYETKLAQSRSKDLKYGTTTVGPHRDDINFLIKNWDLRKYGSQGQQRTASLALKLSEIELVKKAIKDTPVLMLDDVLSELDKNRQDCLLQSIEGVQTFLTCTGLDEFVRNHFSTDHVFYVEHGMVSAIDKKGSF